jgi:polysaccharide biosynthesis protein PslH
MRILLLAPMLPLEDGGGAIPVLLHSELRGLCARHDVTFVAGLGDEPWEARAAEALARSGADVHIADRRQPHTVAARWRRRLRLAAAWGRSSHPWRTVWFGAAEVQRVLDELGRTRSFDIVAVEDSSMAMLRLPPNVPAVLTEYEVRWPRAVEWRMGPPRAWPGWALRELDWRRWRRFQRACWRRFDRIQVFTDRDARAIAAIAPDVASRVRVNPFGCIAPKEADPANEEPGSILFVGNFTHFPNRDAASWLATEILPAVRRRYPQGRLRIIGTSPPPEIRALAGDHIEVVGDAAAIEPYLEAACVVAAPVRTGGGMRMKVLHALASGKAVVTTSRGAEGYLVSGTPDPFVAVDDAEGFAVAVAGLLEDGPARRDLGRRARAFALQHHSVDAWVARLENVYEEAQDR